MASICIGTVKSTGARCTFKARDINGFCHRHHSQSVEYAKTHPWTVVKKILNGKETYIKIPIVASGPDMVYTSENFR
jgi:hypothetical protein